MERPKLRWVDVVPFVQEGRELVAFRDTEGITDKSLVVSKDALPLISLMDGTRTVREIQADYMREFGDLVYIEQIEKLVEAMDDGLLLENDRYASLYVRVREEYEALPVRESSCAGRSYPDNRMDLLLYLDEMFRNGCEAEPAPRAISGILAPHIDYARGYEVYRKTYPFLKSDQSPILVVLGTCHQPSEKLISISLKDFATPIETARCSAELADRIRADKVLKAYIDEWPHRNEHSIELQIPLIQFNRTAAFEILPVLTGSMHEYIEGSREIDDGEMTGIVGALRTMLEEAGRPYLIISGADLAHIGAQFGDTYRLNRYVLEESKEKDQALLDAISAVDARRFFETIKTERDERRICGLTPIYLQLRLLEGQKCSLIDYGQWSDGQSSVSFAGGIFYR